MSKNIDKSTLFHSLWDDRIYQSRPASTLDQITGLIWEYRPSKCLQELPQAILWEAFYRFIYSLIVDAGLFRPQSIREILQLKKSHLLSISSEYIKVPRAGGFCPVYLPGPSIVFTISLMIILHRGQGHPGGKNRVGTYPDEAYLLPGRSNPTEPPSFAELEKAEEIYKHWLGEISLAATGREVSLLQLTRLSSAKWFHSCPPTLAAYIAGIHLLNPIPVNQFSNLTSAIHLEDLFNQRPKRKSKGKERPTTHYEMRLYRELEAKRERTSSQELRGKHWDNFKEINEIIRPYTKLQKDQIISERPKIKKSLGSFRAERLVSLGLSSGLGKKMTWKKFLQWHKRRKWGFHEVLEVNAYLFSGWLRSKFSKRKAPNPLTIRIYLYHLLNISRFTPPTLLLTDIDTKELARILDELDLYDTDEPALLDSFRDFRYYASKFLSLTPIQWKEFRGQPFTIHEQPLITEEMLARAVSYLLDNENNGLVLAVGLLLGYYFGLRIREMTHLQLGDIHLTGTPTVFIFRSKGDKNRIIEIFDLPEGVRIVLQDYYQKRIRRGKRDLHKPFLVNLHGDRYSEQMLSQSFEEAFRACDVDSTIGENRASAHLLRHSCANRWLLEGIPWIEVTRKLGHSSAETTLTYIHCLPRLQQEFLKSLPDKIGFRITIRKAAGLIGLSEKRTSAIKESRFLVGLTTYHELAAWLMKFLPNWLPEEQDCGQALD